MMLRYRRRVRVDEALTDLRLDPALPLLDPARADLAVRPWLALCPPDVVVVDGFDRRTLTALCPGTRVAVRVDAPGSRARLHALARATGVCVERELIAVPNTRHPIAARRRRRERGALPVGRTGHGATRPVPYGARRRARSARCPVGPVGVDRGHRPGPDPGRGADMTARRLHELSAGPGEC